MATHERSLPRVERQAQTWGLLAEFETVDEILAAARKVREAGYTKWDAYTPFPVHGLDKAMGLSISKIPWFVFWCGIAGFLTAMVMQWWMNAVDYKLIVSGKPFWSIPANVPIGFELMVLFSALGTIGAMLFVNGLPRHSHPLDGSERFRRVTSDRFFIGIEAVDPKFSPVRTAEFLASLGSKHIEELED